jgi:hypothetical protein
MTKSDWADYSKTFECKEQEKFKIDVYIEIHESLNFLQRRRNRGFFNNLWGGHGGPPLQWIRTIIDKIFARP